MKQEITLKLTKDLLILCDIFCVTPEELLRSFINHVSLPRYMNCEKNELVETATTFLLFHAPTHEDEEMQEHLFQHVSSRFCSEIADEVTPGPEAEGHIRRIVQRWHEAIGSEESEVIFRNLPYSNLSNHENDRSKRNQNGRGARFIVRGYSAATDCFCQHGG